MKPKLELTNPEKDVIELIDSVSGETLWRKNIRDLKYPAPTVYFGGDFHIVETCPDTGYTITIHPIQPNLQNKSIQKSVPIPL